jgi:hypothetical protein
MPKWNCLLLFLVFLISCSEGKKSLSGNQPVNATDFFSAFTPINLPVQYADTNLARKSDTTTISYAVFHQFVPDTALKIFTGKDTNKTSIHPVGKIDKEAELYLLANFTQHKKTRLGVFLFNKDKKFVASQELMSNQYDDNYRHSTSINKEPTFVIAKERMTPDNQFFYTRQGYAFNAESSSFMVIINESNEDTKKMNTIINPIDTLASKNKFSGDYVEDKKNFMSVRDTKDPKRYQFFIHFEKNDGGCTGELKGELTMVSENKAIFKESGDPCVIDFTFTSSSVKLKEQGSCGNHRGIRCYFDDSYEKKKKKEKKK